MSAAPLRLVVLARDPGPRVQNGWKRMDEFLRRQSGVEIVLAATTDEEVPLDGLDADLVVVLGGDGSILRACRMLGARQRPIVGVNFGRLGFLADMSPEQFEQEFDALRERRYEVVPHLMFQTTHRQADGTETVLLGLNETVVTSAGSLKMIEVVLAIDGRPVTVYSCDGLIVSTPVGSTAYNLAAGGPILEQALQAFVVTPICPHALTNRPVVDRADRTYTLTVPHAPEGTQLLVDGQVRRPLRPGDTVEIRRAPHVFELARLPGHNSYDTLHRKLGWGGQPNYVPR